MNTGVVAGTDIATPAGGNNPLDIVPLVAPTVLLSCRV